IGASFFAFEQAYAQLTYSNFVCDYDEDTIIQIERVNNQEALIARERGTTGPEGVSFGGAIDRKIRTQTDEILIEASIVLDENETLVIKIRFPHIMTDRKSLGRLTYLQRLTLADGTLAEEILYES